MVKTLRITSVLAVLLAMAICALLVISGVKNDENIENFLNAPGLIEVFKAASGNGITTPVNQVHPLVQQAQDFAKIIAPPPTPRRVPPNTQPNNRSVVDIKPLNTPKFTIKSTSVYELNPELSMALIEEGQKTRWVRQSTIVNHLLIEQVKDGVVIVRNGEETFEMKTKEKKFAIPSVPVMGTTSSPIIKNAPSSRPPRTSSSTPTRATAVQKTENEEERMKRVEELFLKLKMLNDASTSDSDGSKLSTEEKAVQMQKLIEDFKKANMNIGDEESEKLEDLGEYLLYLHNTMEEP